MPSVRVPPILRSTDPQLLAPLTGLQFLTDDAPGVRRLRCGRGFRYVDLDGKTISGSQRSRFESLAIPPAWTDVWLAPREDAYLQATGRDAADRKQYRYHERYREFRDRQKFERLRYFPRALTRLRKGAVADLDGRPGDRSTALGAAIRLIDTGLLRIGNEESATNGHFGASTLSPDHLDATPVAHDGKIVLHFTGKGGADRQVDVTDEQLVETLLDLATPDTERLFWYETADGRDARLTSDDINAAISDTVGDAFTAKDFRTWGGSRAALEARAAGTPTLDAIDEAADALGNTRAVARSSYVHPAVVESDDEIIRDVWQRSRSSRWFSRGDSALAKLLAETPSDFPHMN